jgi:glycosyltransferase involved in cell wall biosynthesis
MRGCGPAPEVDATAMTSKHVCLVTPGHLSTNPRLVKEADALVGAAYRVTVVASRFIEWADMADSEFNDRQWAVHRVAFGRLAGRWTCVTQRLRQELAALVCRWTGLGAAQAFHPVVPALTRAASAVRADLYVAHNLAALPAAAAAARLHGAKLGFDAEDFHRGEYPERARPTRALELTRVLEDRHIPRCDHLTAASPGIARAYAQACGVSEPPVVLNVFPRSHAPQHASPEGSARPRPSLYWFSQTLGPHRGLETVVEALSLCQTRPSLYLRGAPVPGYLSELKDRARHLGISDQLHFLPPAAPSEMVALASVHDVGIASEPGHSPNNEIALSNKLFTFLLAGIPVLASATQAQAEIAVSTPGAVFPYAKTSATALAQQIDTLFRSPEALEGARQAAWELGQQRFNWDVEQGTYLKLIATCLD